MKERVVKIKHYREGLSLAGNKPNCLLYERHSRGAASNQFFVVGEGREKRYIMKREW